MASSSVSGGLLVVSSAAVAVFVVLLMARLRFAGNDAVGRRAVRRPRDPFVNRLAVDYSMATHPQPSGGVAYPRRTTTELGSPGGDASSLAVAGPRAMAIAHWALRLAFGSAVVAVIATVVAVNAAGLLGRQPLVIIGSSMEPAIAKGSLVLLLPVQSTDVRAGDVVTVRSNSGTLYTHRVVAVADSGAGPLFQLKGDANASADASLATADRIAGIVDLHVPVVGYLWALLATPSGLVGVASMLTSLYCAMQLVARASRLAKPAPQTRRFSPAPIAVLALVLFVSAGTASSNALLSDTEDVASSFSTATAWP